MKKKLVCAMITAFTLAMAAPVMAAPSIGQIIPENPIVVSGDIQANWKLAVQNADTKAYKNADAAAAVTLANDETKTTTIPEILEALKVDLTQQIFTNKNNEINPADYEQLTPFVDLVLTDGAAVEYNIDETKDDEEIKAKLTFEAAKEQKKEDLMIMLIDPDDAKVSFIEVEELDAQKGELTATFKDDLGAIALLKKTAE